MKEEHTMFYIYIIQNLKNGKVYIGQSIRPKQRCYDHMNYLKNGNHPNCYLQSAYNQEGRDYFIYYILDEHQTQEEVNKSETTYIRWYKSLGLCYNLTDGGEHPIQSEETKRKIGDSNRNKVRSEETKKKLSEAHQGPKPWLLGKPKSEETKKKLSEFNRNRSPEYQERINEGIRKSGNKPPPRNGIPWTEEQRNKFEATWKRKRDGI